MSLETILQALEREGEQKAAQILEAAKAEAEEILAQARTDAEAIAQRTLAAVRGPVQVEQMRIVNQAKLEAQQIITGSREEMLNAAVEAAARRLAGLKGSDRYAAALRRLAEEAVLAIGAEDGIRFYVRNEDRTLMEQIARELGVRAQVSCQEETRESDGGELGGVIAISPDQRIRVDNTLETRLRRVASLYRSEIARLVLGANWEA